MNVAPDYEWEEEHVHLMYVLVVDNFRVQQLLSWGPYFQMQTQWAHIHHESWQVKL